MSTAGRERPTGPNAPLAHHRRHPAEITSDRLLDAFERWYDKMDGAERDAISRVRQVLEEIADGTR